MDFGQTIKGWYFRMLSPDVLKKMFTNDTILVGLIYHFIKFLIVLVYQSDGNFLIPAFVVQKFFAHQPSIGSIVHRDTIAPLSEGLIVIISLLLLVLLWFCTEDRLWGVFFLQESPQMSLIVCFRKVATLGLVFRGGNLVDVFLNKVLGFCVDFLTSSNRLSKSS